MERISETYGICITAKPSGISLRVILNKNFSIFIDRNLVYRNIMTIALWKKWYSKIGLATMYLYIILFLKLYLTVLKF